MTDERLTYCPGCGFPGDGPGECAACLESGTCTAACSCLISEDLGDLPCCPECDRSEACCECRCESCGKVLRAVDDCLGCVSEASYHDDVDHTEDVLGDVGEQTREVTMG
jgi:hypothetical protein